MLTKELSEIQNLSTEKGIVSTGVDDSTSTSIWYAYISLAVGVGVLLLPWMRLFSGNGDEAISLEGARRVLQGQIPGHDFFEIIGPGEFYWQALPLKLFGLTISVSRGLLFLTGISLAVLIYHIAQRIKGAGLLCAAIFAAAGIARFAIASYHWDADLFGLIAFTFLIAWQRKPRTSLLLLSAGFAGATTLIMQQKGFLLGCALLVSAFLTNKKALGKRRGILFGAVYIAPLLVAIGFFAAHGALGDLVWTNLIWPAQHYMSVNGCPYGMTSLSNIKGIALALSTFLRGWLAWAVTWLIGSPLWIVVILPALLLCLAFVLRKRAFTPDLVPFWICGAALWIAEFQRPDYSHLVWGCPIWLVLLSALAKQKASLSRIVIPVVTACCIALGFIEFVVTLNAPVKLAARNGTLYGRKPDDALQFLEEHTKRHENVFVYPYYAMYNFLSDTNNPTRYTYLIHGMHTPEQFREAASDLEKKQVRLVLWDTKFTPNVWQGLFPSYKEPEVSDLILENYLLTHYHQMALKNGFRVMERNRDEAE